MESRRRGACAPSSTRASVVGTFSECPHVARTSSLVGTYQRAGAVTSTFLAPLARLERATRCLEGSRSIQLSYRGGTCGTAGENATSRVAAAGVGVGPCDVAERVAD